MSFDPNVLQQTSLLSYLLVFLAGAVTSIGPCNIAMIPLVIAFVGGKTEQTRRRSMALSGMFVLGLSITYVILGVIAAMVGGLIGSTSAIWYYLVAGVCLAIGLQILGVINIQIPMLFGGLRERISQKGLLGALLLGLVSGLVASQCATPVLAAIVTYVLAIKAKLVYGASLLFVYALGRGIPIFFAGTFTGVLKQIQKLGKWSGWIEKASGAVMIIIGLYFIWIA